MEKYFLNFMVQIWLKSTSRSFYFSLLLLFSCLGGYKNPRAAKSLEKDEARGAEKLQEFGRRGSGVGTCDCRGRRACEFPRSFDSLSAERRKLCCWLGFCKNSKQHAHHSSPTVGGWWWDAAGWANSNNKKKRMDAAWRMHTASSINSTVRLVELYAERTAEQKKRREDMWKDGWRRIVQAGSAHTCLCQYISTSICGWSAAKQRDQQRRRRGWMDSSSSRNGVADRSMDAGTNHSDSKRARHSIDGQHCSTSYNL